MYSTVDRIGIGVSQHGEDDGRYAASHRARRMSRTRLSMYGSFVDRVSRFPLARIPYSFVIAAAEPCCPQLNSEVT